MFVSAVRENDWPLHLCAVEKILPYYFAFQLRTLAMGCVIIVQGTWSTENVHDRRRRHASSPWTDSEGMWGGGATMHGRSCELLALTTVIVNYSCKKGYNTHHCTCNKTSDAMHSFCKCKGHASCFNPATVWESLQKQLAIWVRRSQVQRSPWP